MTRAAAVVVGSAASISLVLSPANATHSGFVDKTGRGSIEIVSVDSDESQQPGDSGYVCDSLFGSKWDGATMSDNARYVAFTSDAALSPQDDNRILTDVYVRDRKKGTTTLESVTRVGLPPEIPEIERPDGACVAWSFNPTISGNGRYLAFTSYAALTGEDEAKDPLTNLPYLKVYVRDLNTNRTELISKGPDGKTSLGDSGMTGVSLSRDGSVAAFISEATDLVEGQSTECGVSTGANSPCRQAYAFDRKTGEMSLVSASLDGALANNGVFGAEVSGNGHFVMFDTPADNVTPNDDNICARLANIYGLNCPDVFLRDLHKDETELISVGLDDTSANEASFREAGADANTNRNFISSNGRYVLFNSSASDLVPAGGGGVFVRDRKTRRTERVNVNSDGSQVGASYESMTEDGRYVMQYADSCFLLQCLADPHTVGGTLVHDRLTGQTDLVKLNTDGTEAVNRTEDVHPSTTIGSDGRYFLWTTTATSYVRSDANGEDHDVFLRDLGIPRLGSLPDDMKGYARITVPGDARFSRTGILELGAGDDIYRGFLSGRLIYRPDRNDLFVRMDVDGEASIWRGSVIGARFKVGGVGYEVRAVTSALARVGLFRCDLLCREVAILDGGYGTTGMSMVATIPLAAIGLEDGGVIEDAHLFGGIGNDPTHLETIKSLVGTGT
ncbi:MAG: hypothetical protein ACRDLB_12780 [Actinomycetota bacterium]